MQLVRRALREDEEANGVRDGSAYESDEEDLLDGAGAEGSEVVGAFFRYDTAADERDEGTGGRDGRLPRKV